MSVGWTCPTIQVLLDSKNKALISRGHAMVESGFNCGKHKMPCRIQGMPRPKPANTAAPLREGSRAHRAYTLAQSKALKAIK